MPGKKVKTRPYSIMVLVQKSKGSSAFNEQKVKNIAIEYRLQSIFPNPVYSYVCISCFNGNLSTEQQAFSSLKAERLFKSKWLDYLHKVKLKEFLKQWNTVQLLNLKTWLRYVHYTNIFILLFSGSVLGYTGRTSEVPVHNTNQACL